ncbi:MAG: hypothetical protein CSA68_01230 [Rhodobacterales bacterium]|nr:MAG: hypothetical protein CSA68_01230 [Rhodobacterales bacterium]
MRYDRCAHTFISAIYIAATVIFWLGVLSLKRYAKNLNHLTLPEIKDFNALSDALCFRYFVKRYR